MSEAQQRMEEEGSVDGSSEGENSKPNPNICSNRLCSSYKNTEYNKNNKNNKENLCRPCKKQYEKQRFCLYCNQIYFEQTDDGKEWIMCDECERWVHTQCAGFNINSNSSFCCFRCKKIEVPSQNNLNSRRPNTNRTAPTKVPERRKTQECSLNNYGFYWQLSPAEMAEDMQKLKQFMKR